MRDDAARPLTEHEERYLEHVRAHLTDVSRRDRKTMLAAAVQNLAERPATADFDELLREIGGPHDYAAGLRGDLDVAEPGSVERSRRRQRWRRILVAIGVVVLIVGAGLGFARWQTWQATFAANSSGVCVEPDAEGNCDVSKTIDRSNVFGNVAEVMCVPGTKVTLVNGIEADSDVTITSVDLGLPEGFLQTLLQLDNVSPWSVEQDPDQSWYYPGPGTWPLEIGPTDYEVLLRFHLTLVCDRSRMLANGSTTLEQFVVHYRAFGKDRETRVPLLQALQITYPGK